jgi:outer membrane protein W
MKIQFIIALTLVCFKAFAQPYTVANGNTRHRFAQLEVGMTQYFSPKSGQTQILSDNNVLNDYQFGAKTTSAFFIGGTHFWGHADFALTIPIKSFGRGMGYGVDLQAKYFPWRIEQNKLRPYIGVSMNPFGYSQNDGPEVSKIYFPLMAGLNFYKNRHQFELGAVYNYNNAFSYHVSRTQLGSAKIQPLTFSATYKYTLETTAGSEKNWRNGETAKQTKELGDAGKLNSFSVAVGPTSAFRIKPSDYLSKKYPFAGQHSYSAALEYGLGYYWHKPDMVANIAYRTFKSSINAYGYSDQVKRKSLTLEAFKFVGDFHGFSPFVGANINYENLSVTEKDREAAPKAYSFKGFKPGLTFGWDIRPDRLQSWTLRTNMRWTPNLNVKMGDGSKNALDQLEFNFIQLVVYPERLFKKG